MFQIRSGRTLPACQSESVDMNAEPGTSLRYRRGLMTAQRLHTTAMHGNLLDSNVVI